MSIHDDDRRRTRNVFSEAYPMLALLLTPVFAFFFRPVWRFDLAWADTSIVFVGAVVGFFWGGYRWPLDNEWHLKHCRVDHNIKIDFDFKEGPFLTMCAIVIGFYIVLYNEGVHRLLGRAGADHASPWPVPWLVAGITGVTVGALAFCAVRYAGFIRTLIILDAAVATHADRTILAQLRTAAFTKDQLFEPAGTIFVTIGIASTFLGLAVGLVTLDLSNPIAAIGPGYAERIGDGAQHDNVAALHTFMGCMGLALGVSMLGVLISVAAQWLRGQGPHVETAALLNLSAIVPTRSEG